MNIHFGGYFLTLGTGLRIKNLGNLVENYPFQIDQKAFCISHAYDEVSTTLRDGLTESPVKIPFIYAETAKELITMTTNFLRSYQLDQYSQTVINNISNRFINYRNN